MGLMAVFYLAGCAQPHGPEPESETTTAPATPRQDFTREKDEVAALLAYYQELLAMPAEDLRHEYQSTSQSFARDKTEQERLKLALLMNVPGAAWRDDAKLLALLEGAQSRAGPAESPRRQFLTLLQKLVAERLREQRRGDELQQKLNAMLNIERSLRGRQTNRP